MDAVLEKEIGTPADHALGAWVWVVFWRSAVYPDGSDRGAWDLTYGRVVAADAATVCYELGAALPPRLGGDDEGAAGSILRFVRRDRVFADRDAAAEASAKLPRNLLTTVERP